MQAADTSAKGHSCVIVSIQADIMPKIVTIIIEMLNAGTRSEVPNAL